MYSVGKRITHNNAIAESDGELLRVVTPGAQWAYAVEFEPQAPQAGQAITKTGAILNVSVRVHEGEIGLGLLTLNGGEYVCETRVAASEESELVDIPVAKGSALGPLVLRNTSATGRSRADIEFVGCEITPGLESPYWTARRIVHNEAVCKRAGDLLRIVTPPEQWADAVEFPPQDSVAVPEAPKVLKVRIHVLEGKIGIGVLTPNNVHNREIRVGSSVEAEFVAIPLSSGTQLGSLMVRNLSRSGRSKADIQFLACETSVLEDISKHDHEIAINPEIFASFKPWCGFVPAGFFADWSGILTSVDVWGFKVDELAIFNRVRHENQSVPIEFEHGLDWAALAQAVGDSGATFRMAALGAGWGRWLAAGAALAAQIGRDYRLLGVEAEPQHFEWMLRHFKQNNISEDRYIALNAAAVGKPGECWFAVGNSQAWYGQSIIDEDDTPPEGTELLRTRGVTINEALDLLSPLDYLHMDIQGAELDVLSYRPDRLDREVRLVNIGTHSLEIEAGLRKLFRGLGWECVQDIEMGSKHAVRVGEKVIPEVQFGDGVQVWRNPRLRALHRAGRSD